MKMLAKYNVFSFIILLFSACLLPAAARAQAGCKDPLANNYNPAATVNDGSCTYNATNYTPPVKTDPLNSILIESSGLQMAGNFLWSFNDKGGQPAIYRIDTLSSALLQTVNLEGATNNDWEELTFDGTYFYVGDFGNNADGARTDLKIYKFPLSAIPDYTTNAVVIIPAGQIEIINFTYADQPQPPVPVAVNTAKFDCEAFFVENNQVHLFSKNWADTSSTHYVINSITAGTYAAAPVETYHTGFLVTAMGKAPGQQVIVLYGYQVTGFANHNMLILSDYSGGNYFNGNKRKIELPGANIMGQGEGLCFRNGWYGYTSNEKVVYYLGSIPITITQKLRSFDISAFTQINYTFNGDGAWTNTANWMYNTRPPAAVSAGSKIVIDPVTGGSCTLSIPYILAAGAVLTVNPGKNFITQ